MREPGGLREGGIGAGLHTALLFRLPCPGYLSNLGGYMNPFESYGIEHLSASTCNMFASSPAMFVLTKVMKRPNVVGAAAHRGTAVEEGVAAGLMDRNLDPLQCAGIALDRFKTLTALCGDSRLEKERDSVPMMVDQALKALRPYGVPSSMQGEIRYEIEGLAVPFIGFYDFEWNDGKILVDLKTTHALQSQISNSHARQLALYHAARGGQSDAQIAYVTPKKYGVYRLENAADHVKALARIGFAIQKFLSVSKDPGELASLVAPDVDSFYFADPLARKAAFDVWGV